MNVQNVKSAFGRRLRDPRNGNVLPNVADEAADEVKGVAVDLDDPYWFRSLASGDAVLVDDSGAMIAKADKATADPAPLTSATPGAPAAPSPATATSATSASAPIAAPAATPAPAASTSTASASPAKSA